MKHVTFQHFDFKVKSNLRNKTFEIFYYEINDSVMKSNREKLHLING